MLGKIPCSAEDAKIHLRSFPALQSEAGTGFIPLTTVEWASFSVEVNPLQALVILMAVQGTEAFKQLLKDTSKFHLHCNGKKKKKKQDSRDKIRRQF